MVSYSVLRALKVFGNGVRTGFVQVILVAVALAVLGIALVAVALFAVFAPMFIVRQIPQYPFGLFEYPVFVDIYAVSFWIIFVCYPLSRGLMEVDKLGAE